MMVEEMIQNILRILEQILMFCRMRKCQREQRCQRGLDNSPTNSFHLHNLRFSAMDTCDISSLPDTLNSCDINKGS